MKRLAIALLSLTLLFTVACGEEEPVDDTDAAAEVESVEDVEDHSEWDELKGNIVGVSDKDFKDITKSKPSKVRNDNTGKWKYMTIADSIDIEEYALSYNNEYIEDGEIHFVINFNYNTTTVIREMGGLVYVDVREYIKREEHDASDIGNGMPLVNYRIYPDGDIEKIEEES